MSRLFGGGGSKATPATPPSISSGAQQLVEFLKRRRGMRGRAAALLTEGGAPATAKRQVTGQG